MNILSHQNREFYSKLPISHVIKKDMLFIIILSLWLKFTIEQIDTKGK